MSPFFLLLGNRYQRAIDERSVRTENLSLHTCLNVLTVLMFLRTYEF